MLLMMMMKCIYTEEPLNSNMIATLTLLVTLLSRF